VDVLIHFFLTSALAGDELSALRSRSFTPRERASGTRWIEGWLYVSKTSESVLFQLFRVYFNSEYGLQRLTVPVIYAAAPVRKVKVLKESCYPAYIAVSTHEFQASSK
jgi:hypothetical protein